MADGFLGRWSQRKAEVRSGKVTDEPSIPEPPQVRPVVASTEEPPQTASKLPTLEDARALGVDSDFKPFVARGVDPLVRNAAMKKLFADPHFNVMDRMDIYIDDYSLPDPLSTAQLRQMVSAKFLQLFEDEAKEVVQPPMAVPTPPVSASHVDPDLQLQQDHSAQSPGSGERTE